MPNTWTRARYTAASSAAYQNGGGWEQHGVDWGNGTKPIELWHKHRDYVVFKVPAGKHWSSITNPSVSHPGSFVVCKLIEDRGDTLITEELFQMPVSARGRGKI